MLGYDAHHTGLWTHVALFVALIVIALLIGLAVRAIAARRSTPNDDDKQVPNNENPRG